MTQRSASPARVLIVDDHPAVREALAMRISAQKDLTVCGEACDVGDALELVSKTKPDIAVIDISLKTGSGIDLIKRIKLRDESVRMLVWSMFSESLYAERALRAGAHGYITKEHATDGIIDAIHQILAGKVYLSPGMTDRVLNRSVGPRHAAVGLQPEEVLSDREMETFQLLGQGLTTHDVAERMKVSPKTVETYRGRIKDKLRVSTPNELIRRAVQWVEQQV